MGEVTSCLQMADLCSLTLTLNAFDVFPTYSTSMDIGVGKLSF